MAINRPPLSRRGLIFRVISIAVIAGLVAFAALAFYVYRQSVGKFELRRLSLPTRIFTDLQPLKPGMALQPDDLVDKLNRLGYRSTNAVAQPGDYATSGRNQIDVYTRPFSHPTGAYPAQPVRIVFRGGAITSVVSLEAAHDVTNAALEPELLTSILSDQLENRRPATLDQVPQRLQDAVVVTEDVRFWHHPGVDPIGIARAMVQNIRGGAVAQGGSTLTQQLVKNYYLTSERTFRRKIVEAFMAIILDARYSKREILEAYLNDIYLGRNRSISIVGVGEASHFYFGKPVSEINVPEAALLAGMIRSPNNYSPFTHPDKALERRNTVLQLMLNNRKIDRATYDQAMATPLPRQPFRSRSGLGSIPFYVDRVLQEMANDYGIKDVKGRGLEIYTAIDLAAQDSATRTLVNGLEGLERGSRRLRRRNPQEALQGVMIVVDVPSGEIRALVGGRNYDTNQFNRALNARRQVGSLIKPFVYLTAFEPSLSQQNITPATLVSDTRFVLKRKFAPDWSPRNYGDVYRGTVTVQEALEQSLNSASVRIGLACGLQPIFKTMHTLGVTEDLQENPAILLGAVGIPPIEMADAYSTIARVGARVPLRAIRFVTNDRGKLISSGDSPQPVQVFPARDAFILDTVMKGPVDRGTAHVVRRMGFKKIAAGKTGTTNDLRDAWFIGFTPQTLALTWVGFDDNTPVGLAGGDAAAPIWAKFMIPYTAGQPDLDFAAPPGIVFAQIDETSGGLAVPECPPNVVVNDAFKAGTQPTNPCPLHSPQAPPPPAVDQFGNPIAIDTAGPPTTEGTGTATPESTLTGGFPTETNAPPPPPVPPPTTTTAAPPTSTAPPPGSGERQRDQNRDNQPPPSTNTSPPPSTSTSPPPI